MQIGEFKFRLRRQGFLQPEPGPAVPFPVPMQAPIKSEPLAPNALYPSRVNSFYQEGDDRALFNFGAQELPVTAYGGPQLPGVVWSPLQTVSIAPTRTIMHTDTQGRRQAANTNIAASFAAKGYGYGLMAGRGSATPSAPGGGPAIQRPAPRYPFSIQVPRYSTLPDILKARSQNS